MLCDRPLVKFLFCPVLYRRGVNNIKRRPIIGNVEDSTGTLEDQQRAAGANVGESFLHGASALIGEGSLRKRGEPSQASISIWKSQAWMVQ